MDSAVAERHEEVVHPRIQLEPMPQQIEVITREDDWTGITSTAERRRLQNRLNQRAYRKRHAALREKKPRTTGKAKSNTDPIHVASSASLNTPSDGHTLENQSQSSSQVTTITRTAGQSFTPGRPISICQLNYNQVSELLSRFDSQVYEALATGSPRLDLLLNLVQFNVLRAMIKNTTVLGFALDWIDENAISPFALPNPKTEDALCPLSLQPTILQCTVPHHPWIDLFPFPAMRDNLLKMGADYDDTDLCLDVVEVCSTPTEYVGLIVWGDPWNPSTWEASEGFLRKWAWVVRGCKELYASTNYWREKRGEERLAFDMEGNLA